MSGVASFIRPMAARTRTTPERRLMVIGMVDDVNYAQGHSQFQFVAIEEDGLVSRFDFSEVVVDWRYDEEIGGWMDINPTNEDAALDAEAGVT